MRIKLSEDCSALQHFFESASSLSLLPIKKLEIGWLSKTTKYLQTKLTEFIENSCNSSIEQIKISAGNFPLQHNYEKAIFHLTPLCKHIELQTFQFTKIQFQKLLRHWNNWESITFTACHVYEDLGIPLLDNTVKYKLQNLYINKDLFPPQKMYDEESQECSTSVSSTKIYHTLENNRCVELMPSK